MYFGFCLFVMAGIYMFLWCIVFMLFIFLQVKYGNKMLHLCNLCGVLLFDNMCCVENTLPLLHLSVANCWWCCVENTLPLLHLSVANCWCCFSYKTQPWTSRQTSSRPARTTSS